MLDEDYNFFKDENLNTDSDTISIFKEDASTYMGVKTIQEGTVADTNKKEIISKKSPKKSNIQKKGKKTKKNISSSESSFSSSSSESYIDEQLLIEKYNKEDDNKLNKEEIPEININKNNLIDNKDEKNNNEIMTEFHWDEGGNVIYLTGSFCEWKKFFLMEKKESGNYFKALMLPPGFYQYKFKVDDNWAFSKKQPKFEDNNGNVNNFIDTTNYENKNKKEEKKEKQIINNNTNKINEIKEENNLKKIRRNPSINSIGILNNSNYSTYIPLKRELNIKPLSLPGLYKTHYILNEKKNKTIIERKFSQIEYIDHTNNSIHPLNNYNRNLTKTNYYINNNNNNLYVGFQNLYHIHSNHLHSKEVIDSKNIITSIITRYRTKFSTFIYYKDKKQRERSDKGHSKTVKISKGLDEKIGKMVKGHRNTIYK